MQGRSFRTVVSVKHDRNTIGCGESVNVMGSRHTAEHLSTLVLELEGFARVESGATIGQLNDDGRPDSGSRRQCGVQRIGANDVDGGQGVSSGLGVIEKGGDFFAVQNAGAESGHGAVSLMLQDAKVNARFSLARKQSPRIQSVRLASLAPGDPTLTLECPNKLNLAVCQPLGGIRSHLTPW